MSFEGDSKQWMCGKGRTVNLLKVSSIVRDIGEPPCLHQLPLQVVTAVRLLSNFCLQKFDATSIHTMP